MNKIIRSFTSRQFVTGLLVGGALFCLSSNVRAQTTLAALMDGGSLTNGDKVFSDFANLSQIGDLSVPLSDIAVVPIIVDGNLGIRFQSALWSLTGANLSYDLSVDFQVSTTDGSALITADTLALTGGTVGTDLTATHIAEGATDVLNNSLANNYVYINSSGQLLSDTESLLGAPFAVVDISKDFAMQTGNDSSDQVFVSHFDQTFTQVVPEPASAMVLGLGGLVLLGYRRFTR
jgi:hypothetical protein